MLRGFALAILLLNLALLLWGSSRAGSERAPFAVEELGSATELPTLILLDEVGSDEVGSDEVGSSEPPGACMRLGPLSADDADLMLRGFADLDLAWQRSESADGTVLEVEPGSSLEWPETDLRALAEALAAVISPCRGEDLIAPEPSRP